MNTPVFRGIYPQTRQQILPLPGAIAIISLTDASLAARPHFVALLQSKVLHTFLPSLVANPFSLILLPDR